MIPKRKRIPLFLFQQDNSKVHKYRNDDASSVLGNHPMRGTTVSTFAEQMIDIGTAYRSMRC